MKLEQMNLEQLQTEEKNLFGRTREILKTPDPTKNEKCGKRPECHFSAVGALFVGFLESFSSFGPGSPPISPNLGRFRATFFFLGVIVPFSMSKIQSVVHLRHVSWNYRGVWKS